MEENKNSNLETFSCLRFDLLQHNTALSAQLHLENEFIELVDNMLQRWIKCFFCTVRCRINSFQF